jgi:diketogulonate reductase-like aldo/keto reductase
MQRAKSRNITVNETVSIPRLGFGTWRLGSEALKSISTAIEIGFRHIDTADVYGTHGDVGRAVNESGLDREDFFITTKLWKDSVDGYAVGPAVDRFLSELDTAYLDLLLIHWPVPRVPLEETLAAMKDEVDKGTVRQMGFSNYNIEGVQRAIELGFDIANNQIEYHPRHKDDDLATFCMEKSISVTAYSPFGGGQDLQEARVKELCTEHNLTPSQVILQWLLERNLIVIPRSTTRGHIEENYAAFQAWLAGGSISAGDL